MEAKYNMGSSERNQLPRFLGQEVFDAWRIGDEPTPDPLDIDLGDGTGNRRIAANARDFKALEQQLCQQQPETYAEPSILLRLRQLGDRGLRAAIQKLKGE